MLVWGGSCRLCSLEAQLKERVWHHRKHVVGISMGPLHLLLSFCSWTLLLQKINFPNSWVGLIVMVTVSLGHQSLERQWQ